MKRILLIAFLLLSIPVLCSAEWVAHFDNTNWTATSGSWDTNKWVPDVWGTIYLAPINGWEVGYRPTKIRITFTGGGTISVSLKDNTPSEIAGNVAYSSGGEEVITFVGSDIAVLEMASVELDKEITNIEFYYVWPHDFMGVSNADIGYISGVSIEDIQSVGGVQ